MESDIEMGGIWIRKSDITRLERGECRGFYDNGYVLARIKTVKEINKNGEKDGKYLYFGLMGE